MNYETLMYLYDSLMNFGWGDWGVTTLITFTFVTMGLMSTFLIARITIGWFI